MAEEPIKYVTTDQSLSAVANAIRVKGGTTEPLVYPTGFVNAIDNISAGTDVSDTTATESDVLNGKYFYTANGIKTQGSIINGSATTPDTTITANPIVNINPSNGILMVSVNKTESITPIISEGYISTGTAGRITVTGSRVQQLPSQAGTTFHPSTSDQTITGGKYITGTQTFKAVTMANLTPGNIKKDVVIKIGDSTDDDCVTSVTGTYESGGGSGSADVIFIDYDGTVVATKTKAGINAMSSDSELPENPTHEGLISQGWNWTVAQLKTQLAAMPDQKVYVGQMYVTESGATEIDVVMQKCRLDPILTICVNGTVTVDWGDNTTPDTVTGTSETIRKAVRHTYASEGNYTISISNTSGTYSFFGDTNGQYTLLRKNTSANENRIYANCVQAIRLGNGISDIRVGAFYTCYSLSSITIPSSVTSIGAHVFYNCYALSGITIPDGVTKIETSAFQYCRALSSITIPNSVKSIGNNAFNNCRFLSSITIPSSVTSIGGNAFSSCYLSSITIPSSVASMGNSAFSSCYSLLSVTILSGVTNIMSNMFQNCYSLSSVTIPSSVTSIGGSAFQYCYSLSSITIPSSVTSINGSAFNSCYSLSNITIPSSVTSIGASAFSNCYGVAEYHLLPNTVPTLSATAFASIVSDCKIYVPYSADHSILAAYQSATNWADYASYMVEEDAP